MAERALSREESKELTRRRLIDAPTHDERNGRSPR